MRFKRGISILFIGLIAVESIVSLIFPTHVVLASPAVPSVAIPYTLIVPSTSITFNGEVTATNGSDVTSWGTYYSRRGGNYTQTHTGVQSGPFTWSDIDYIFGLGGSLYTYQSFATNSSGTSVSDPVSVLIPPDAPSQFSAHFGDKQIYFTWTRDDGDYTSNVAVQIQYSMTGFPTSYTDGTTAVAWTTDESAILTGLTNGQTYYFSAFCRAEETGLTEYAATYSTSYCTPSTAPDIACIFNTSNYLQTLGSTQTSFEFNCQLIYGNNTTITVYWGTFDGGTDPASWANTTSPIAPVQPQNIGSFCVLLTGLTPYTRYYMAIEATNSDGDTWLNNPFGGYFYNAYPSAASSILSGISDVTTTSATINGYVSATGGDNPTVVVYWGTTNGGTTPSNWQHNENPTNSTQPQDIGTFYLSLSGLIPNTQYYYAVSTTNIYGTSWAVGGWNIPLTFTTTPLISVPNTFVIGLSSCNSDPTGAVGGINLRIPYQEKSFVAAGRTWLFYLSNDSGIFYISNPGNNIWTTPVYYPSGQAYELSTYWDGTYLTVVHAVQYGSLPLYYRRGVPNSNGTITWCSPEIIAYVPMPGYSVTDVDVCVNTDGYAFISFGLSNNSDVGDPYVITNANNDGSWRSGSIMRLDTRGTDNGWLENCVIRSMADNKVYALYASARNGGYIYGKMWNGSWGSEEHICNIQLSTQIFDEWNAVVVGDDINLAFISLSNDIIYVKRTNTGGWLSPVTVLFSTTAEGLVIDANNSNLSIFWNGTNNLYASNYASGIWSSPIIIADETANGGFANSYDLQSVMNTSGGKFNIFYEISTSPISSYIINCQYIPLDLSTISADPASSITRSAATVRGSISYTGGDNPIVTIYWGTMDGGTTPGNWQHSTVPTAPTQPQGVATFILNLSGLNGSTKYYYSASAMNSVGTSWIGSSLSFNTPSSTFSPVGSIAHVIPIVLVAILIAFTIAAVITIGLTPEIIILVTIAIALGISFLPYIMSQINRL